MVVCVVQARCLEPLSLSDRPAHCFQAAPWLTRTTSMRSVELRTAAPPAPAPARLGHEPSSATSPQVLSACARVSRLPDRARIRGGHEPHEQAGTNGVTAHATHAAPRRRHARCGDGPVLTNPCPGAGDSLPGSHPGPNPLPQTITRLVRVAGRYLIRGVASEFGAVGQAALVVVVLAGLRGAGTPAPTEPQAGGSRQRRRSCSLLTVPRSPATPTPRSQPTLSATQRSDVHLHRRKA